MSPAPERKTDCLIVGGGVAGLATAWYLARALAARGDDPSGVLLLESERQFGVHSSGLNAAILRTLMADPVMTRIGRASAEHLHRPPAGFTEVPLVDPVGLVVSATPGHEADLLEWIEGAGPPPYPECAALALDPSELARLVPHYRPPVDDAGRPATVALHLPGEGHIEVGALVEAFARGATAAGARLETGATATELMVEAGASPRIQGVLLEDGTRVLAPRVLLAGGAWALAQAERLPGPRLAFHPRRRHLLVTARDERIDARWPVVWNHPAVFYAKPESSGMMLCACDESLVAPPSTDPRGGGCPREEDVLAAIAEAAERFVPGLADAGVVTWWAGWRTFTDDHRFAIGPDPTVAGLSWAAGLGGHGMTTSFEVGRLAACALLGLAPAEAPGELRGEDYDGAFLPARLVAAGTTG